MCIYSHRQGDTILFHHEGGVEIGDVDAKVNSLRVRMMLQIWLKNRSMSCQVMNMCEVFVKLDPVILSSGV